MKFTINIECSPEEARQFLGLPDMTKMQDAMMDQMKKNFGGELPAGMEAWADIQKMMFQQMEANFETFTKSMNKDK